MHTAPYRSPRSQGSPAALLHSPARSSREDGDGGQRSRNEEAQLGLIIELVERTARRLEPVCAGMDPARFDTLVRDVVDFKLRWWSADGPGTGPPIEARTIRGRIRVKPRVALPD